MNAFWTVEGLAKACGGQVSGSAAHPLGSRTPSARDAERVLGAPGIAGITQDTRALKPGMAYLAIKGGRLDGHAFVAQAFAAGAACALVEAGAAYPADAGPLIVVKSAVFALQQLARVWRDELAAGGCQVIAICGSNGKTSTRHLLHQVLTACGLPGSQSPKSFNNHLGVPLTLLAAKPADKFVAAEIGTNHPGEIANLAQIVRPDIAVITSIGEEHLEFFKDLDGVAQEEAAVLSYMTPRGLAVLSPQAAGHTAPYERMTVGVERVVADLADAALPAELSMPGAHGRSNAAIVARVARHLGCSDGAIAQALGQGRAAEGRWQTIRLGRGVTLIHDAYNANPSSVNAGLDELGGKPDAGECWPCGTPKAGASGTRKPCMVVLGDMFELGEAGPAAHRAIAERVLRTPNLRPAIFIGSEYARQAMHLSGRAGIQVHETFTDELPMRVAALADPGDTLWLKGSRGMRLERLIPALEARFGKPV